MRRAQVDDASDTRPDAKGRGGAARLGYCIILRYRRECYTGHATVMFTIRQG